MRVVNSESDLEESINITKTEAEIAFGDPT